MEGWLLNPSTGFKSLRKTLPGLRQFMMVGQWVMPGGGLPSGLMTARSAIQAVCKRDRTPFAARRAAAYVYAAISLVLGVYLTYGGFKSTSQS